MNTETGEIKKLNDLTEKQKKSGIWKELTVQEHKEVLPMNRVQRRAHAKKMGWFKK